jgi:hypothetical protein
VGAAFDARKAGAGHADPVRGIRLRHLPPAAAKFNAENRGWLVGRSGHALKDTFATLGRKDLNVPQMVIFEGQEGLKKVYLSMMREAPPKSILYLLRDEFVWQKDWEFIFEQDWHNRVKRLKIEKDIHTKLLVNRSPIETKSKKFYQSKKALECRFLPSQHSVKQFAMYIIGDIVSILSMEKNNLVGIKITNQHLADNFTNLFQAIWQTSTRS